MKISSSVFCLIVLLSGNYASARSSVLQIERGLSELITTQEIPSNLPGGVASIQSLKNPVRKSVAYCEICKSAVNATIELRKSGASDEVIGSLLEKFCIVFYKAYEEICRREVQAGYLDTVLFIIDNKQDLTAERACSIWLQKYNCVDPGYEPWSIDIPANRDVQQPNQVEKTSGNVTKVLHLTDFHYDPEYLADSLAVCDQPLCCQAESTKKSGGSAVKAGSWGDYHDCDTPWKAVLDAIEEPKKKHAKIDYIYFTGDIVSHKIWATNKKYNSDAITKVMQQFKDTYGSIPVYPVLGNHESHPASVFSSQNITQADTDASTQWLLDLVAKEWLRWLPKETEATIKYGGYYNVLVKPGFRVIGLNSNYCYISNLWLIYKDKDPHGQLQWLVAQLEQAESNGEKVHILSHVPPGSNGECHKQWSHEYRRIIERFSEVIVAQFNGHTHEDELKVFYDTNNPEKVINVAYNGGSVTSFIGLNPDYRVYDVSSRSSKVLDFEQWYYNLTEANQNPQQSPNWQRLYRFKEAYGMEDMEPQSFHDLLQRMLNNPTLAEQYYRFKVRDSDVKMEKGCVKECIIKNLCSITNVEFEESIQCKAIKNKIKSKYSMTN